MTATGRKASIAAALTVVLLGAGAVVFYETRRAERDRHEILNQMRRIESLIRAHDMSLWINVESGHATPPADDSAHEQMKRDFDRLGHLADFSMRDVQVDVSGDVATATYRIEGRSKPPSIGVGFTERRGPVPRGGELRFERQSGRWTMAGHHLIE